MRILFMADVPPDPDSGAAGTEYQTIEALRALGHDVECLWREAFPHRIRHGNLHYLFELPRAYRDSFARLWKEGRRYDVLHVNQPHGYLAARYARALGPQRPVFVHRSHGFEPRIRDALAPWRASFEARRRWPRRVASSVMDRLLEHSYHAIAREADGHIVSSSLCADYLHAHYGVRPGAVAVIAQAAPAPFVQTDPAPWDAGRVDRLLHVAQFAQMKAPTVVAEAVEQVFRRRPGARLTWVCAREHHGAARNLLGPLARDRVHFEPWRSQPELMQLYDRHGIFLFPSYCEGFGKVFLEAMSRGLVVVASDEGGARDIITSGVDGFRIPVGDASALAASCLSAMDDPDAAATIARHARATAKNYTWQRTAAETVAFYERLIEERP